MRCSSRANKNRPTKTQPHAPAASQSTSAIPASSPATPVGIQMRNLDLFGQQHHRIQVTCTIKAVQQVEDVPDDIKRATIAGTNSRTPVQLAKRPPVLSPRAR